MTRKIDYTKVCWQCGGNTMQPSRIHAKGWFGCSACGATYTKPLKLHAPAATLVRVKGGVPGEKEWNPRAVRRLK